jgi:hypothetical protein
MIGGALAFSLFLGSWHLWAADAAVVNINPTTATGETGVDVDGCRLFCSYVAPTPGHEAQIVVRGNNPGSTEKTHALIVSVLTDPPADMRSRMVPPPTVDAQALGSLTLPPKADGTTTVTLAKALPAGARIKVDIGNAGAGARSVVVRGLPLIPVQQVQVAQPPGAPVQGPIPLVDVSNRVLATHAPGRQ